MIELWNYFWNLISDARQNDKGIIEMTSWNFRPSRKHYDVNHKVKKNRFFFLNICFLGTVAKQTVILLAKCFCRDVTVPRVLESNSTQTWQKTTKRSAKKVLVSFSVFSFDRIYSFVFGLNIITSSFKIWWHAKISIMCLAFSSHTRQK